ncbi:TIGR02680 family protein [Natronoglycomyces albus]|uniref:TIGR02680 family protein n=1 Tax=Natronoglycomyces albus TaxID=2811108 RepID=A0A895XIH9_9ACTN|nr:TIGR02680 family protein [Natronoglycomyces albus]QSB05144.1 TIGR02680 family protein [Natronoglycomyces albus]
MTVLPIPRPGRWQPLRLGLVDLFYYDRQEFWFRDGRLMLRGNNGTGKSKVLALTLPFLLDGDSSSHKVEPDGDPKKRMDWNLLLGGKYDDRLGYSWMEFGRVDEDGRECFRTIGVGLRAVRGKGVADKWFFSTVQRVRGALDLVSDSGVVLSREKLEDAIGTDGEVVRSVSHYRRLVDEQLFRLGEERYEALIDLLVQLRQPQLSRRPDNKKLSNALSEALTPVDQDVLTDVANAFHDQATQRDALEGLKDTALAAKKFGQRYLDYARVAARRAAEGVRRSQSRYERIGSDTKRLNDQLQTAELEHGRFETEHTSLSRQIGEARGRIRRMESRRELADLNNAQEIFDDRQSNCERAKELRDQDLAVLEEASEDAVEAAGKEELAREKAKTLLENAEEWAGAAALRDRHRQITQAFSQATSPPGTVAIRTARAAAVEAAVIQQQGIDAMRRQCQLVDGHQRTVDIAIERLGEAERRRDTATDVVGEADRALEAEREGYLAEWNAFAPVELVPLDMEEVGLQDWVRVLSGPNPAAQAAHMSFLAANSAIQSEISDQRAVAKVERKLVGDLDQEYQELNKGHVRLPPRPLTRTTSRSGRAGAPLWKLIDFHDNVSDPDRAGYEAALEAAGILDAWVTPSGQLLEANMADDFLTSGEREPYSVASILRSSIDRDDQNASLVAPETVDSIIAAIGIRLGRNWIGPDGSYRVGCRQGTGSKTQAEYIGHAAREAARTRRLDALREMIAEARTSAEQADKAVVALEQRQRILQVELGSIPTDQALQTAQQRLEAAEREAATCKSEVERQQHKLIELREELGQAVVERDELAADLGLPTAADALRTIEKAIASYQVAVAELWAGFDAYATTAEEAARRTRESVAVTQRFREADRHYQEASRSFAVAKAELDQLRKSIGADVDVIRRDLDTAREELVRLDKQAESTGKKRDAARDTKSRLEGTLEQIGIEQTEAKRNRAKEIEILRGFADTGLLGVAAPNVAMPDPDREWAPDPAVQLARRLERDLSEVPADDQAWERVQSATSREYRTFQEAVGPHGHQPNGELVHSYFVVTVNYQARQLFAHQLATLLYEDIEYREQLLSAKERELLEEHLINDVAYHLHQLIDAADEQVQHINAELDERPTSTGMRIRLKWRPRRDGPEGLAAVRRILLHDDSDMWSPDDQQRVSAFLHRQIQDEAAADPENTWKTHLSNALDYRRWHEFRIERHQNGEWKDAIGPASGGERVLTVSLPLFAAASSHYRSAHENAPRMIMLDEAFAGVDDDSRSKCLGLLANFDLDVAMTSEREWGFYSTVPGIRTHQLVRTDDIDAVYVTVFEWDGHTRTRIEQPV